MSREASYNGGSGEEDYENWNVQGMPDVDAPYDVFLVRALCGRRLRVTISDGRTLIGRLWCVDGRKNIVMIDVEETRIWPDEEQENRSLPIIMVPWNLMKKFEICKDEYERAKVQAVRLQKLVKNYTSQEERSNPYDADGNPNMNRTDEYFPNLDVRNTIYEEAD